MKRILALVFFPLFAAQAEVVPAHCWNFDKFGWHSRQAVENLPAQLGGMKVKSVANDDGTFSLMARETPGSAIVIR